MVELGSSPTRSELRVATVAATKSWRNDRIEELRSFSVNLIFRHLNSLTLVYHSSQLSVQLLHLAVPSRRRQASTPVSAKVLCLSAYELRK